MSDFRTIRRRNAQRGSNLIFLVVFGAMMLGFLGAVIFLGMQAYGQNELQKAANTAAMAGARLYFSGFNAAGTPQMSGIAAQEAGNVFDALVAQSPILSLMTPTRVVTMGTFDQSITVAVTGVMPTPVLSAVGINQVNLTVTSRARSLMYQPTAAIGVIGIAGGGTANSQVTINLDFPLLAMDNPGSYEMKVEQLGVVKGYGVEACSGKTCYSLENGASQLWPGDARPPAGVNYGTTVFDLTGIVGKANALRFTDDGIWDSFSIDGSRHFLDSRQTVIDRVSIIGYAALCPGNPGANCSSVVPKGFAVVQ
ncbi:MAG: hypothetical protein AB7P76_08350 [Candidatus Melainabacteria bacterium]